MTRASCYDDILGLNVDRAVGCLDGAVLRPVEGRPSLDQFGTGTLQQSLDTFVQTLNNGVLP